MNIVEPILFQARFQPEAPALCAQGSDVVSYAKLAAHIHNVGRRATALGLKRGNIVALSIDNEMLHAAVLLGLTRAGMVTLSVAKQKPPAGLKIDAVLSNTDYPFAADAKHLPLDFSWIAGDGAPIETARDTSAESDEICHIILTSGTTGDPKAVALSHKMVMARNARYEYVVGNRQPACSRVYMHMGLGAALGYQFLTYMLGRGGTLFFRGENNENTLRAFEIFQIQSMLTTPAMLAQLLAAIDRTPSIEIHLDTILSGGGLLPPALVERVRPRLCSHLITGYGATETAISATAPAHRIAHIPGAAGYVTPGIRFEIVDDADRPVAIGAEGNIRVASELAVDRYIDDPAESAQVFRDGWFYPGDLGSLTADNLLIISGRRNEVLNVGGGKMAAEKVEAVLVAFAGVSEAAAFVATDTRGVAEIWAAVVCPEKKLDIEALRAHCRLKMLRPFVPAHIVALDALPINDTGKVDRSRLKQMVMAAAHGPADRVSPT